MNTDLTHPEILTIEQLQKHLLKFVGSDITQDKYELIQLFYKYVAPLPQRKFRTNRLGTILATNQKQSQGQKRALSSDIDDTEKPSKSKPSTETFVPSEKHESDRGIYTITMRKSNTSTVPIKLKRPTLTTTTSHQDVNKRLRSDETQLS